MEATDYLPHWLELRKRLIYCFGLFIIIFIALLLWAAPLYTWVAQPLLKTLPSSTLIATQVTTPFLIPFKLAAFCALLVTIPFILYHLWRFITPALYLQEKSIFQVVLWSSVSLFYSGIIFAHFIVLPLALKFFIQVAPHGVVVMTDIRYYFDFILVIYLAFAFAFQVPIVTFLLIYTGVCSLNTLQQNRPYVIIGAFVVGMLLTPPDVVSQILLAVPLLGLFEIGLLLARLNKKLR